MQYKTCIALPDVDHSSLCSRSWPMVSCADRRRVWIASRLNSTSQFQNVFVQIVKCICPNFEMYLSKLWKVFVQIVKCICPNCTIRVRCEDEAVSVWIGIAASQWAKDSPIFSCWATIIDAKDNNYIHYIYTIYIIHCRSICYQHRCCSSADKNVFVRFQLCNLSFHF